jgi:hypothetical protein
MNTACGCLQGEGCQLSYPKLSLLSKERSIRKERYKISSLPLLDLISSRFGANGRFRKKFPKWLVKRAQVLGAEHALMSGAFQHGTQLDELVIQEVTFILR